jgi:putative oxidoreductase
MNINRRSLLDKVEILLRIWIAYILVTNSGVGFITPLEKLGLPPHIFQILDGMWKTGFMMHMVKAVELTSGLMILFNFYVPVALLALIPVVINIYGIHIFLFHSIITDGLSMLLICGFLVFRHREKYRAILVRK